MASVVVERVVLSFSKLVRDSSTDVSVIDADTISSLESVAQELAGAGVIVEVEVIPHE